MPRHRNMYTDKQPNRRMDLHRSVDRGPESGEPDRRIADDGKHYTRDEFIDYYGGTDEWLRAPPAPLGKEIEEKKKKKKKKKKQASVLDGNGGGAGAGGGGGGGGGGGSAAAAAPAAPAVAAEAVEVGAGTERGRDETRATSRSKEASGVTATTGGAVPAEL
jgi:hypothetical protein